MTDDGRPQPQEPEAPARAANWSDGANWLDPLTGTTGTAPAACGEACFVAEDCDHDEPIVTTGVPAWP